MKRIVSLFLMVFFTIFCCACKHNTNEKNESTNNAVEYGWHLQNLNIPDIWGKTKGENVTVAVIDSGINYDLLGENFNLSRILATYNAYDCNGDMTDFTQHGTAMVSIIGANGDDGFYGIAPSCNFVIIKALNEIGRTNSEALVRAINFAIENKVDIINLSLGSENVNESVSNAISVAVKNNIVVTSAVGDQKKNTIFFPAVLSDTLSVAAIDCNGNLYCESNYSNEVDVLVPGVDIKVPKFNVLQEKITTLKSGSSVATAIFSGVLALYLSYYPKCNVDEVYSTFRNSLSIDMSTLFY